ncbi:MAG: hypothetical protein WCQ90_06590 [Deltaproteobacteria bacterium]
MTTLGMPKGSTFRGKLGGKEDEIRMPMQKKIGRSAIARILDTSRMNLAEFIRKRRLYNS